MDQEQWTELRRSSRRIQRAPRRRCICTNQMAALFWVKWRHMQPPS